jgi:hypothetical protein
MALIPLVLEFSHVAKDSNLSLVLSTGGVAWSFGEDSDGSSGFSYNALYPGETRPSCINRVEFTDSLLAVRTSSSAAADSSFTLALFVDVPPHVDSLQGHCTLNSGATVRAHLGYEEPATWISGPLSMIVPHIPKDIRRVRFNIQRPSATLPIQIELMTLASQPGFVHWCFGPDVRNSANFNAKTTDGTVLPLRSLNVSDRQIEVVMDPAMAGRSIADILIEAYVQRVPLATREELDRHAKKLDDIYLKATCSSQAKVIAQVGTQRAQYLTTTHKRFRF